MSVYDISTVSFDENQLICDILELEELNFQMSASTASFDGNQLVCDIMEVKEFERVAYIKEKNLHTLKINDAQDTLLHFVSESGNIEVLKLLIESGSDVNAQNIFDQTPLILCIEKKPHRFRKVIYILYENDADIHMIDKSSRSAVQIALSNHDWIYQNVHKFFLQLIYFESMSDSQETARILVDLHYPISSAVLLRNAEVIEHMIRLGCAVDSRHPVESYTAIAKAVEVMDLNIVQVLTEFDANVDLRDGSNFHPISYYGKSNPRSIQYPEIIRILLEKSVQLKDLSKEDIIHQFKYAFAFGNKEVIEILSELHEDILKIRDEYGQTPLHYLSRNYHSDITEVLTGKAMDTNVRDVFGCPPIYIATEYQDSHINNYKFLLENGADVNLMTLCPFEYTPLFSICHKNMISKEKYCEIFEMFIQYGLNIQSVNSKGITVFDVIIKYKHFHMAEPPLAHLAMMDDLEKPIREDIRKKISACELFENYFDFCKSELVKMKSNVITENLTLYMIVVNQVNEKQIIKRCRFSVNAISKFEELEQTIHPNNYYYAKSKKYILSIVLTLKLLQKAAPIVCKIFNFRNNSSHIVVTEILDYLKNDDLQNLIHI